MHKPNLFTFEKGLHALKYTLPYPIYNLGCPKFCEWLVCVDQSPSDDRVDKADVYEWLFRQGNLTSIYSKNLIEHLSNPGIFLRLCHEALIKDGQIMIITDNAEFLPYYSNMALSHTGVGAHGTNEYVREFNGSTHKMIFSKLHLQNLLKEAGFVGVDVRRVSMGAKLVATAIKI